jgi:hypothetical protein
MTRTAASIDADRAVLRGLCLVVKCYPQRFDRRRSTSAPAGNVREFPRRPQSRFLSESIPLFFVARNRHGLWVAREAEGRVGGMFLFKSSALRFAKRHSAGAGCATMFLTERFELDVENQGPRLITWVHKALRWAGSLIPDYPPAIPLAPRLFEENVCDSSKAS